MRAHIALQKYKEITNLQQEIDKVDEELKDLNQVICQKEKVVEKKLLHANSMVEDIMAASKIALSERNLLPDKWFEAVACAELCVTKLRLYLSLAGVL